MLKLFFSFVTVNSGNVHPIFTPLGFPTPGLAVIMRINYIKIIYFCLNLIRLKCLCFVQPFYSSLISRGEKRLGDVGVDFWNSLTHNSLEGEKKKQIRTELKVVKLLEVILNA